jgi:alkane 1-monooxygenase
LLALAFLVGAPWPWWIAIGFGAACLALDWRAARSPEERRQPRATGRRRYDLLLYALFVLHWANLVLTARLVAHTGWWSAQVPTALLLLVVSSGLCAGVTGHELIHRRAAHQRWMGRLLLASILYEHFFTEHLRGHHARVGLRDDPTTARLGEGFGRYLARSVPGQLVSAWRLERARLAAQRRGALDNRVLHGHAIEVAMAIGAVAIAGGAGVVVFVIQAVAVTVFSHVVNYLEHWGIERRAGERVTAVHSWDATDRATLFAMVGLTRHADHHVHPSRPFHLLHYEPASPKLPRPFATMIWMALVDNARFQALMVAELHRSRERSGPTPT